MDWDRKSTVIWLDKGAGYPTAEQFSTDIRAVKWDFAIEALSNVYIRQDDPVPPVTQPWMLWNDGTIFTPGQVGAVREVFEQEVKLRGGAFGRAGLEHAQAFA